MRDELTREVRRDVDARDALRESVREAVASARAAGREALLEHEGLRLAGALGLDVPRHVVVHPRGDRAPEAWRTLVGERLVVKTLAADIPHKSDVGAVRIVSRADVPATLDALRERFAASSLEGLLVEEFVAHDVSAGAELLLGLRTTDDFGAVVTLGLGGLHAEGLARHLASGHGVTILSPALDTPAVRSRALAHAAAAELATRAQRGRSPRLQPEALDVHLSRWLLLAEVAPSLGLLEFEVNPVALVDGRALALDALGRVGPPPAEPLAPRPRAGLARMLRPRTIAIAGVSTRMNPGRIMLRNVLDAGFPREDLVVLKPGGETIDGCRCVPDLEALGAPADLLVIALAAPSATDLACDALRRRLAASIVLVSSGFDEHGDGHVHAERLRAAITEARTQSDGGAVLNGANCLGVRSREGRYDTLFIPRPKLPFAGRPAPLAIVSQSGALAVALCSRLDRLDPHTVVTFGNQLDLTLADHLEHLADHDEVRVFACYAEGLRPGDGPRLLRVARRLAREGRPLIVYRAGRNADGARASASHTAALAGDYAVFESLMRGAGALVADSLDDLSELTELACALHERPVAGLRLGAMSNAGFECVALADHEGLFELAQLGDSTRARLGELLAAHGLDAVVGVRNPLDVTPILDDEGFAEAAAVLLDDAHVDIGVIGCVPLSGALATLPPGEDHAEDLAAHAAVASRLARLFARATKPWVAVVDAGPLYDPLARALRLAGLMVFRRADRALSVLGRWAAWRREQA